MMSMASLRKSITEKVFERVGGYSYLSSYLKNNHSSHSSQRHHRHNHHKACENDESDDDYYEDDETVELMEIEAERTKNVLILMNDIDGGHSTSSEAIRDAFRIEFGDEDIIFVKDVERVHRLAVKRHGEIVQIHGETCAAVEGRISQHISSMDPTLQANLCRTSSLETRIRSLTRDAVKEIQRSGMECGCGKPMASSCRSCLMREVLGRLSNAGYNSAMCKSKWRSSLYIPSGEHSFLDVVNSSSLKKGEVRVII